MTDVPRTALAPGYTVSRLIKGGWHLAGGHGAVDRDRAIAYGATGYMIKPLQLRPLHAMIDSMLEARG